MSYIIHPSTLLPFSIIENNLYSHLTGIKSDEMHRSLEKYISIKLFSSKNLTIKFFHKYHQLSQYHSPQHIRHFEPLLSQGALYQGFRADVALILARMLIRFHV